MRRGKAHKRCGRPGKCLQEAANGSPLKKSRVTCPAWTSVEEVICFLHVVLLSFIRSIFSRFNLKMGTSLESVNALKSRALEVALSSAEANALEANGITSLARLAFAACHPGQTPADAQLQPLLHPIPLNPGNTASLKRLIFESQTLVCNDVKGKANRK